KKIRRQKTLLPEITLRRQNSLFKPYLEKAKAIGPLKAGVIYPIHEKIIHAVDDAYKNGLIIPTLIGPRERILTTAISAQIDISQFEIIDVDHSHAAIMKALQLVHHGEFEVLIRGGAIREDLLHAMQRHEKGLVTDRI